MVTKWLKRSFLLCLIFILVGCEIDETGEKIDEKRVIPIEELEEVEYFRNGALEHILEGELNNKGEAVGFHYNQLPTKKGKIVQGTETNLDGFGVYEAKVIVEDVEKTSNSGRSTFFPDSWDTQEVVDAINEAYETSVHISGNTFEGLTNEGMVIRMYLDNEEKIISAFPIYER